MALQFPYETRALAASPQRENLTKGSLLLGIPLLSRERAGNGAFIVAEQNNTERERLWAGTSQALVCFRQEQWAP